MIDESPNTTLFPRVPDPALISTYCVMQQQQTSRIVMQNQQHLSESYQQHVTIISVIGDYPIGGPISAASNNGADKSYSEIMFDLHSKMVDVMVSANPTVVEDASVRLCKEA